MTWSSWKAKNMGSGTSFFECPRCGRQHVSLELMKKLHTKNHPFCLSTKWQTWMYENEMKPAGRDEAVLDRAGVTRQLPVGAPYQWARNMKAWRENVDPETGEIEYRQINQSHVKWKDCEPAWVKDYMLVFYHVAPVWAVELSRRLQTDQGLIKKFSNRKTYGGRNYERQQRRKYGSSVMAAPGKGYEKYVLPIELRAKIIRVASNNAMAREMVLDDIEAAMRIIKDAV